jgi:hypothetical protein
MDGMWFLVIMGAGVAVLGLAFVIWMAVSKQRKQGTPNWPHVQGEITASRVVPFERETPFGVERTFTAVVDYRYMVSGLPYTSANQNFLPHSYATSRDLFKATRTVSRYPAGSWVRVYYNPTNPKQSALELPKPVAHNAVLFYGIANVVAGIAIVALGIVLLP